MDGTAIVIALIGGVVTIITSTIAAVVSIMSLHRSEANSTALEKQSERIEHTVEVVEIVKKQTNGLLAHVQAEAEAKGLKAGHIEGLAEGKLARVQQEQGLSAAAIKEGAHAAVEPIAEEAVRQGAREAVADANKNS